MQEDVPRGPYSRELGGDPAAPRYASGRDSRAGAAFLVASGPAAASPAGAGDPVHYGLAGNVRELQWSSTRAILALSDSIDGEDFP